MHADSDSVAKPWMVLNTKLASGAARIALSAPAPHQHAGCPPCLASVVDTTKYGSTQLIERTRIRVAFSSVPTQVVAAQLTGDRRLLVVVTMVRPAEARDAAWGTYFRFQALSCKDWVISLPVIDVLDGSGGGMAAPIFSIRCLLRTHTVHGPTCSRNILSYDI